MRKYCIKISLWNILFFGLLVILLSGGSECSFPMPAPKFKVRVEQRVMVPMRDEVMLSTDLYFPEGAGEKLSVILVRTPYNKKGWRESKPPDPRYAAYMFAGQGYVVAVQDVRGKFESDGEFTVSADDVKDGYDAVTWVATQPWSSGKVGTYGCSYLGENQIEMAKLKNPYLKAMIPQAAGGALGTGGNYYHYFGYLTGGAFELSTAVGWFIANGSKIYLRPPRGTPRSVLLQVDKFFNPAPILPEIDLNKALRTLPVIDILKKIGVPPSDFEGFVSHEPGDPWWNELGYIQEIDHFDVPALHISSWCDLCVAETLYFFNLLQKNAESALARENQFVIISPTIHCRYEQATEQTISGERNVGDAQFDFWGTYLRWFDYWLKGIENKATDMPKVQIYVIGKNKWRADEEWPLASTQYTTYYLHSDGHANSRFGTGVLSTEKPGNEPSDQFIYDPKTPVPTVGGSVGINIAARFVPPGYYDQSELETRHDVLVYTTPVLRQGIEVTGPLKVVLYVSSSAKDTDFTAKLVDVFPNETAYNVQDGILRARYREGFNEKVWIRPGQVYEVTIDLHATSIYFESGHRIRLEISSSNFPRYDRNLNTGGNNYDETRWVIAKNTIHLSKKYPSHIILPIIN